MSSIANAMAVMGYHSAQDRTDVCAWCAHLDADYPDRSPPFDKPTFRCKLGGFRVSLMAVCDQHVLGKARAGLG